MADDHLLHPGGGMSRRRMLAASAAAGGAAWLLRGVVRPDSASAQSPAPPGFPAGPDLFQRVYENWAGEIRTDQLWTCAPRTPQDVLDVVNWAYGAGWTARAQGQRHGWAPLTVAAATPAATQVILLDTTAHLTALSFAAQPADGTALVRAQAGASLEALLAFAGGGGYGVTSAPAPGDLSVGGALAIGAHGTAAPAVGETPAAGHGYGSLSNLVTELTAVVWDAAAGAYVLRTVGRDDPDCAALLTHLGRAFVTEAVLRVGADSNLRCVSYLDIPATELFAAPGGPAAARTLADFVDATGRAEAIWFAFTDKPWLKTWRVTPNRPLPSRAVSGPYNYPFSDNIPEPVAQLAGDLIAGAWGSAPLFGQVQYLLAKVALTGDITDVLLSGTLIRDVLTGDVLTHLLAGGLRSDLWGASRNLLEYIRPTTLRETANGYAVLTSRADLQWVVNRFATYYSDLLDTYAARGEFPVNGQVEIRVTGLEDPAVSGVPGARPPLLSALRPRADRPDFDTAVWIDILSLPTTPGLHGFYRDIEQFLLTELEGPRAAVRVEWSKGWAYTDTAAWADPDVLGTVIPAALRAGGGPGWDEAVATLDRLDPHHVFGNPFLDGLLS
ncbi:cholesterol oxidase substrate-binding domain-containing protein [Actinacidiphila sp. ITFR-21]|uniref:cholesterol oxidase substrate-binding domain-containing protein n=1 Tax=Actinacidiphila sp. ITFR-21 TaxID=3075199 RepID=UPI00288B9AA9|nr:cholesterol oxidase substrate-binding domain-containing protein [Streptomyces sp. ITFR-21]WNI16801.1 cholesterol oxidase substrate-binding domain-containing protein [Streptomyces sp. ITFR-21]